MKKKEFAVGETFQLGLFKLKAIEGDSCYGCFFAQKYLRNCTKMIGPCNPNAREDKTGIIFIEVEEDA